MTNDIMLATAPWRDAMRAIIQGWSFRHKLMSHAAKLLVDIRPMFWYYKDTPIEIVYMKSTGYVLLDHVRRLRSPGLNTLADAMAAREQTLKEIATNALEAAETETDRAPASV